MDCRTIREALLEAEPAALVEGAAGPLGDHLASCPACAAAAARILSGTARLGEDLTPRGSFEPSAFPRPVAARRGWRAAALAAAAAITLLLTRGTQKPAPPVSGPEPEASTQLPMVTVPEGRNAMVFRTADPHITVVWFY